MAQTNASTTYTRFIACSLQPARRGAGERTVQLSPYEYCVSDSPAAKAREIPNTDRLILELD